MGNVLHWIVCSAALLAAICPPGVHSAPVQSNQNCSRDYSRRVSHFIERELSNRIGINILETTAVTCPLHPLRNLYGDHEKSKNRISYQEFQCLYCRKRFVNEFYLDRHLEMYHQDKLMQGDDAICLANYCDLFRCNLLPAEYHDEVESSSPEEYHQRVSGKNKFVSLQRCSERKVAQLKQQCQQLADTCFPSASRAQDKFQSELCSYIRCDGGVLRTGLRPPAKGSTDGYAFGIVKMVLLFALCLAACVIFTLVDQSVAIPLWMAIKDLVIGRRSGEKKDYLGKMQENRKGSWVEGILRYFKKMIVAGNKQR